MKIHRLLLIILIFILPLGQFSRISLGDSNVYFYLNDFLLPCIIFFWFLGLLSRKEKFQFPSFSLPLFLFFSVALISLIWNKQYLNLNNFFVSALYLWRFFTYVALYFVSFDLIKNSLHKVKECSFFMKIILSVSAIIAIFGLIQYLIFPDFSIMVEHGWDPHYYRVLSTFFDPNFVGAFLVANLAILILMSLEIKSWQKIDLKKAFLVIVFISAIILTFSRSTYLMLVVTLGIIGLIRERKLLLVGLLFGILSFLLIPRIQERIIGGFINIDDSANFRFQSWERGWEIAKKNLVLGVGYNSYRYAQIRYDYLETWEEDKLASHAGAGIDSSLLLVLATTGISGFAFYLWFIIRQIILSLKSYLENHNYWSRILGLSLFASTCGLLIHSQFVNSLFYPFILEWFMLVFGILEGVSHEKIS